MNGQRRDACPVCGGERVELVVAPGQFYCAPCGAAGPGPQMTPVAERLF